MKKRNTTAILAFLAASLFVFAACDKISIGEKETTTAATTTTTTQIYYEEFEEVVTDASGEPVTDEEGNTSTVTVTKPVVVTPAEPETAAPEGEKVEVELDKNGVPKDSKLQKVVKSITDKGAICLDSTMDMDGQNVSVKMYIKGEKCSAEFKMSGISARVIFDDKSAKMLIPAMKCYFTMPIDEVGGINPNEMMAVVDEMISDDIEYVGTTSVKIDGKNYTCEIYKDGVNTNKYYFDSNDNLKRFEVIDENNEVSVSKFNEFSANVPDNAFTIPSGYVEVTEDNMSSFAGLFGGM